MSDAEHIPKTKIVPKAWILKTDIGESLHFNKPNPIDLPIKHTLIPLFTANQINSSNIDKELRKEGKKFTNPILTILDNRKTKPRKKRKTAKEKYGDGCLVQKVSDGPKVKKVTPSES